MKNYRYYTPMDLAELLIKRLPPNSYESVIDICCGSWNLLKAALQVYPALSCVGVDVNSEIEADKPEHARFYCEDGREFAMRATQYYDLIVSNPPFGALRVKDRKFCKKDPNVLLAGRNNHRYESEMTQANFLLAKEGTVLLFIWPSTFVEGNSYYQARVDIAKEYTINWIAKLPEDTFGSSSRISTYAVAMTKENSKEKETFYWEISRDETGWKEVRKDRILHENVKNGDWNPREKKTGTTSATVLRGNIFSRQLTNDGKDGDRMVLHCTGKCETDSWRPAVRYVKRNFSCQSRRQVKKGDIIICRIGKAAGYWCRNPYEEALISDCILAIPYKTEVAEKLNQFSKSGKLDVPIRGVSTRYITAEDIKRLLLE